MTAPCVTCGTTGGQIKRGRVSPARIGGRCDRCDKRLRRRAVRLGIDVAEAAALEGADPYPAPLPGCRPYRHPEQPAPVPVRWATVGFQERWEGVNE